ncbi:hypothetical protein [Pedobacter paludis]|uniref:Uncharacterized protein n=1 Tax=Pedobacter paludis TaxID=2203212 RepID=A0A317EZI0_9SPHI|nr:hypothetical protein [Pedobacter paludis]PWS31882.1 hypothetical protein DF947_08780 [Pedobacter paludis]
MKKQNITNSEEIVEGQDFADPMEEINKQPSSHGEVANQKGSDFSELEESRMEHPPKHRDENGSDKNDTDNTKGVDQSTGIDKE